MIVFKGRKIDDRVNRGIVNLGEALFPFVISKIVHIKENIISLLM